MAELSGTIERILLCLLSVLIPACGVETEPGSLPAGFVRLAELSPTVGQDIRYAGENNFIGRPVAGYLAPACILSTPAAQALLVAQQQGMQLGYALKVYDCYRPQTAVDDFVAWAVDPEQLAMQNRFYPDVPKEELFSRGYIAERSGHSRGSTVDLTLVPYASSSPAASQPASAYDCRAPADLRYPDNSIDMGTGYDCFDELSHTDNPAVGPTALQNRHLLRDIMSAVGFDNYAQEWWHYTLRDEPFPDQFFSFPVR
ncbi:MAG: M15 family metallopeptidase [Pseudomonadales bacterium]|nr:M15 family metallopeptidase [Pseudomonadales bacterium]